jgi:hypothetical protein
VYALRPEIRSEALACIPEQACTSAVPLFACAESATRNEEPSPAQQVFEEAKDGRPACFGDDHQPGPRWLSDEIYEGWTRCIHDSADCFGVMFCQFIVLNAVGGASCIEPEG